jgi:uncharacterized protein
MYQYIRNRYTSGYTQFWPTIGIYLPVIQLPTGPSEDIGNLSTTFGQPKYGGEMPFEQYHEPFEKLPEETRTFARLIMSLIEEAEAINWYEQRIAVEADEEARQVMSHTQKEEFIHFGMDLEFLLRRNPTWRTVLNNILFKKGDLVELAEHSEEKIEDE